MRRLLALALILTTAACTGEIRKTTTARASEEQLLVTSASERAIARVDASKLKDRTVFVDTSALEAVDKGYIVSAFRQLCSVSGALVVDGKDAADVIVEVRSGGVGTYDLHLTIGIPYILAEGISVPGVSSGDTASDSGENDNGLAAAKEGGNLNELPTLAELGYILHQGWAKIQCFAYERKTGAFVFGWRDGFGRGNNGFTNDIYPGVALGDAIQKAAE